MSKIKFKNDNDKAEILNDLELNMIEEFQATLQYICHRISAQGEDIRLAEAFKSAALDEMAHILFFSDIITKNGGTPRFRTWDVDKSSQIKTMLEKDLELEMKAIERYSSQITRMKDYPELVTIITSVLNDEEDHEKEFTEYLKKVS
jgi:bacterioferritin (cytochrome b1)